METNELIKWALFYRDMGYSVIPVGEDKKPVLQSWKEYQTRLATVDEIEKWWKHNPSAQVGIVTGAISNLVVIDVEKGGDFDGFPETAIVKTGGDGRHFYCKHPGSVVSNKVRVRELTDIRGDGGYVVAPPSVSTKGGYEWLTSPLDTVLAEMPTEFSTKIECTEARTDWKEFSTAVVMEGERNNEAARYAGKLLHDLSPELWQGAGWESLRAWNKGAAKPPLDEKELRATFESVANLQVRQAREGRKRTKPQPTTSQAVTVCMSEVKAVPISWLWPGRIALGKLTLIAGDPGLGKSLITTTMAAIVSKGHKWPLSDLPSQTGSVVMLSAEDDPGDTIRPRLDAATANCARIHILEAVRSTDNDGNPVQRMFSLQKDLEALKKLLPSLPDCRLLIIDPISAYLDGAESHNNSDVRGLLAPLAKLATDNNLAVVMVQHLNKNGGSSAMYRAMGSIAFVAAARAAYIVTKDKDNPDRRLVMSVKNNLAKDNTGLAYSVSEAENFAPVIVWETEPVTMTADEALAAGDTSEEKTNTEWAIAVLQDVLKNGPVPAKTALAEAKQAGLTEKTVRVAREKLGIKPEKSAFTGGWVWSLPGHQGAQSNEDARPIDEGILGKEGHLRGEK